jgi:predicted deacylase
LAHNRELVPEAVAAGVDGLVDVCRHVGIMADADPAVTNEDAWADGQDGDPTYARNHLGRVRAADAGLFVPAEGVSTGDEVTAGDVLGAVYDPTTYDRLQTVAVDRDGLLYSVAREATVSAGATLVGVAERLPPGER